MVRVNFQFSYHMFLYRNAKLFYNTESFRIPINNRRTVELDWINSVCNVPLHPLHVGPIDASLV